MRRPNRGQPKSTHLVAVDLDVLLEVVAVEVGRHLLDEVVAVADVDQRPRVRELHLHEELLDGLGLVDGRVAADALDLLVLLALGRGLDVLVVHRRVLAEVDDAAEEIEEALEGLEGLEKVDESVGRKLFGGFGSNLNTDLKMTVDCVSKM